MDLPPVERHAVTGTKNWASSEDLFKKEVSKPISVQLFQHSQAEHYNSFKHLERQNIEITKVGKERFIKSLSQKGMRSLTELNALKGGT